MSNKGQIKISSVVIGAVIGLITAIVANYFLVLFQSSATEEQMRMQLFLDEKHLFVDACNDYLNLYRDWHELMNYYVSENDKGPNQERIANEFDSIEALFRYIQWKKEFDQAYGRILLLSDNDFGPITMEISTVLHASLKDVIMNEKLSNDERQSIMKEVDLYFIENWLSRAKKEIALYNTGERNEKTLDEYIKDKKQEISDVHEYEEYVEKEYQGYKAAYEYMIDRDSSFPRKMMSKEQFRNMIDEMNQGIIKK